MKSQVFLIGWILGSSPALASSFLGYSTSYESRANESFMFMLELDHLMGCAEIELSQESCIIQNVLTLLPASQELLNVSIPTPLGNFSAQELYDSFNSYLDTDGDGVISHEEILHAKPTLDVNQDGAISLEELGHAENFIKTILPFIISDFSNETSLFNQTFVSQLETYDLDGDGTFSEEEIQSALDILTVFFQDVYPTINDIILQVQQLENIEGGEDVLSALDLNADGQFNESDLVSIQSIIGSITNMSERPQINDLTSIVNVSNILSNEQFFSNFEMILQEALQNFTNITGPSNDTVSNFEIVIQDVLTNLTNFTETIDDTISNFEIMFQDTVANFTNATGATNITIMEIISTLDINGDGNITTEEFDIIESMLISMHDQGDFQNISLSTLGDNFTGLDVLDIGIIYTSVMNNSFVSDDNKDILMLAMDLDGDGEVAEEDFDQGNAIILQFFDQIVNPNEIIDTNTRADMNEVVTETCQLPFPDDALAVEIIAGMALNQCIYNISSFDVNNTETSMDQLHALFNATECIDSLCVADTQKDIVLDWLEQCVDINIPSIEPRSEIIFSNSITVDSIDDPFLACMIDFALSAKPENLEMADSPSFRKSGPDECFLPGLWAPENLCSNTTGPLAIQACIDLYEGDRDDDSIMDDIFSLSYNYQASYSYAYDYGSIFGWSMQDDLNGYGMSYDYQQSYDYNNVIHQITGLNEYKDEFCSILTHLSSDEGKECILPVCSSIQLFEFGYDENDPPIDRPTFSPSSSVVESSTIVPTGNGPPSNSEHSSFVPSNTPSHHPSLRPSLYYETMKSVEVKFQAKMLFENLSREDIPQQGPELKTMVQVLEAAISKNLPSGSTARILKIAGILMNGLSRRRLDDTNGVEIEFEVTKTIDCDGTNCNVALQESSAFYTSATNQLNNAILSGVLETDIEGEATILGLATLQDIQVNTESFVASSVETIEVTTQGSASPSAASPSAALPEPIQSKAPSSAPTEEESGADLVQTSTTILFGTVLSILFNLL